MKLTCLVAITIVLTLFASGPAPGTGMVLAENTSVAVVRPTEVLEGLVERAEAEAALRATFEDLKAEADSRTSEIRALQEQLEAVTDVAAREVLIEDIETRSIKAIAFDQFAARQFDVELALLQQDLYQRIVAAVGDLAQANGIDIVVVNDNAVPIRVNPELRIPRATQVEEQISQRRVMFAADKVDITEELILRMNNAHSERTGGR
jgi:Skp family chaperone for outer membrane proteins